MKVPILTVVLDQLYTSETTANNGPGGGDVKLERIMFFLAVRNTPTNFIFKIFRYIFLFFINIIQVGYCANIGGTGTLTAEETNIIIMVSIIIHCGFFAL